MHSRIILALDASTPRSVVVLGRIADGSDEILGVDEVVDRPNQASSTLVPRVEEILRRAGVSAGELAAIGCGRGPGTFTGTRVAIASAMGLALGAGCPTIGVSTRAAVAASGTTGRVLALLDARRGEVYGGVWDVSRDDAGRPTVAAIGEERCIAIDELLGGLGAATPPRAIGPGVEPWAERIAARGIATMPTPGPTAAGLWHATVAAWNAGLAAPPEELRAVYLRQSYAELGVNAPKRPFVKSPFV